MLQEPGPLLRVLNDIFERIIIVTNQSDQTKAGGNCVILIFFVIVLYKGYVE